MPTPRKTIQVDFIVDYVNRQLADPHFSPEEKRGMYMVLDRILHNTNQYAGFNYVDPYDPEDPEFQINGKKEASRKYHMKFRSFNFPF
jgi:hypothetical protein